jgi:3',5'-cyclic-AMP phosphodiesterase
MKDHIFAVVIICQVLMLAGCKFPWSYGVDEILYRNSPVTVRAAHLTEISESEKHSGLPSVYTVAIITDVHFGAAETRNCDDAFYNWLAALTAAERPAFCICLGDIAEHGYESEFNDYNDYVLKIQNDFGIKTYTVLGNHDLYNGGWSYWKDSIYPYTSFYHFKTDTFSWYFIDSASGSLGPSQVRQLYIAMGTDESPKIVCMHYPLYAGGNFYFCLQDTVERNQLISEFAKENVKIVLVGHTHKHIETDFGSFLEENVPGFLDTAEWGLITVDENKKTVSARILP